MNKNILIILSVALLLIVGYAIMFPSQPSQQQQQISYQFENIELSQDLAPVELSAEELQVAEQEGVEIPSGEDVQVQDLLEVRDSDEIGAIEADLNETDLSDLVAELYSISADLSGL